VTLVLANVDGRDDISSSAEIEDLVYSFLAIMLEHSMRLKDGWKVCILSPLCGIIIRITSEVNRTKSSTCYRGDECCHS